jgi:hypothetical protein
VKATSSRSSALLLLLLLAEDVALVDMAIDDACPDADGDGLCNIDDSWPCGPDPSALPSTVTWTATNAGNVATIELTDAKLEGATKLVVQPGAKMELTGRYLIIDCICPSCLDQIEVGFAPMAGRQGCIYAGSPAGTSPATCMNPTLGTAKRDLIAPVTPGAYTLRFKLGQDNGCGTQTSWWANEEPPDTNAAVHLCVVAP